MTLDKRKVVGAHLLGSVRRVSLALLSLIIFVTAIPLGIVWAHNSSGEKGSESSAAVVIDTFEDASGVRLGDHVPNMSLSGVGWNEVSSHWQIAGNQAQERVGADTPYSVVVDTGVSDLHFETTVSWQEGEAGVYFRYQDPQNWYRFFYDGDKHLILEKSIGGVAARLGQVPFNWMGASDGSKGKSSKSKVFKVLASRSTIRTFVDNRRIFDVESGDLNGATKIGLHYQHHIDTGFDNFQVVPLGPPVGPTPTPTPTPVPSLSRAFDTFTDTEGKPLGSHVPDVDVGGGGWAVVSGTWVVSANRLWESSGANVDNRATLDPDVTDVDVRADVTWQSGGAGLVFRYQDEANWYMFWYDGVADLIMAKVVDGTFQEVRRTHFDWGTPGTTHLMRIRINGRSIRAYVDNGPVQLLWIDPDLQANARVGLFSRNSSATAFDNFAVTNAELLPRPDPDPVPIPPIQPPPAPPAVPGGAMLYDSFTDYDYTRLRSHALDRSPAGSSWSEDAGIWGIAGLSTREFAGSDRDFRAVIDSGRDEMSASVDVTWFRGRAGLVFRYENESNWYMYWYDGIGNLIVAKAIAGLFFELERVPYNWGAPGITRTLSVSVAGEQIQAWVGNRQVMSLPDGDLQGYSKVGLFYRAQIESSFDDVTAYRLQSEALLDDVGQLLVASEEEGSINAYEMNNAYLITLYLEQTNGTPKGVAASPEHLWSVDRKSREVFQYDRSGTLLGSWPLAAENRSPEGMTISDSDIWVVNRGGSEGGGGTRMMYRYDLFGVLQGSWPLAGQNRGPVGVGSNGAALWVVDSNRMVFEYAFDGSLLDQWSLASGNRKPGGMAASEDSLWVVDREGQVFRYGMTGAFLETWLLWPKDQKPSGIAYLPPVPVPPAPPLVSDSFTDSDGTSLASHSPDVDTLGSGWSVASGNWEILADRVHEATGFDADHRATIDTGVANYDVRVRIQWEERGAGVVFRYSDEWNWFMFWFDGASDLIVGKVVGGWFWEIGRASYVWGPAGTEHTLQILNNGPGISAIVDGDLKLNLLDGDLVGNTRVGIFIKATATTSVDDFLVLGVTTPP